MEAGIETWQLQIVGHKSVSPFSTGTSIPWPFSPSNNNLPTTFPYLLEYRAFNEEFLLVLSQYCTFLICSMRKKFVHLLWFSEKQYPLVRNMYSQPHDRSSLCYLQLTYALPFFSASHKMLPVWMKILWAVCQNRKRPLQLETFMSWSGINSKPKYELTIPERFILFYF